MGGAVVETGTKTSDPQQRPPASWRGRGLVAVYALAVATGYVVGTRGGFFGDLSPLTPLGRVGFALGSAPLSRDAEADWERLKQDVDAVHSNWDPKDQAIFDLVVAVRGLQSRQQPNWELASKLCSELRWPRCDRAALAALERSAP